ncbi:uncharacterized protein MEPE_05002 [Melanopsichium pennsylvanicum]|uniref:Uncharacterized protein n=2 Tax=Melanopsichium pennsylvanicum TaxID=63383 RepID=A0AAJ5C784_9BASI|nr:putative protein [Melanopsichium pennsylvanicum 4]SNX86293.1 uncharacterized protein MEPE_05002 [Melanopsichium pennsylvanicum]
MATSNQNQHIRRQRPRRGGAQCSHSARLDVPVLQLGSNMALQLAHERNGLLLSHALSSAYHDRSRILKALEHTNIDMSKAQTCGHCNQLTVRLAESLLHHLLFAKGQLPEPVSLIRNKKEVIAGNTATSSRQRSKMGSTRMRKQDRLLRKLDLLRSQLEQAATHLAKLAANNGEGPSRPTYAGLSDDLSFNDVRLLVVMGSSATMPREVFVLDLIQAVGICSTAKDTVQKFVDSSALDSSRPPTTKEQVDAQLQHLLAQSSDDRQRDAARVRTSSNWERKLVRLLVSDQRLEPFLGTPLAPTKTHLFLSAPASFRCPGWSVRHHLDFDLDRLCERVVSSSADTSMSSPHDLDGFKTASSSPLHSDNTRWSKSACESLSSVADSWPEDGASDHVGESSISSVSDDSGSPSVANDVWRVSSEMIGTDAWLPRCSSLLASSALSLEGSVEASRTGSSLSSCTVYGQTSDEVATPDKLKRACEDSEVCVESGMAMEIASSTIKSISAMADTDAGQAIGRRSRQPKAGSLLSRNLLRGNRSRQPWYAASDSSSVRSIASSLKRAPRCAGLRIDFTDPDLVEPLHAPQMNNAGRVERCWFQCEAVLEGFR